MIAALFDRERGVSATQAQLDERRFDAERSYFGVVLARGHQPRVRHGVLWGVRNCVSVRRDILALLREWACQRLTMATLAIARPGSPPRGSTSWFICAQMA
jgi:hypothetical protein